MKKLITILFFAVLSTGTYATIRTVNNSDTAAQFTTIQAAIDASSSGDSVYVSGSVILYAGFNIANKKISVFGPGWSPDKDNPLTAIIAYISTVITGSGSAGSELHGLIFVSRLSISVDGISFIRNKFSPEGNIDFTVQVSNVTFEGNWFETYVRINAGGYLHSNFLIRNNIFYSNSGYTIENLTGSNILVDHNLWYGPSSGSVDCFRNCSFLTLSNNIFVRRNAANGNSSSSFQANITFQCINDTPWKSNGNRDDGGNVANKNPKMADETAVDNGINNPLLDFVIPSGPANNSANDGKDMGLLYDNKGRNNWSRSRSANLPLIYRMTIPASITIGENLQVTVDARSN